MKTQQFNGRYPLKHGTGITVSLPVIFYKEENIHYAYCAALDLFGYGYSEEEARKSFEITVQMTLETAVEKGTLSALLASCGWQENKPPKTSDLVTRCTDLVHILDKMSYRVEEEKIQLPGVS